MGNSEKNLEINKEKTSKYSPLTLKEKILGVVVVCMTLAAVSIIFQVGMFLLGILLTFCNILYIDVIYPSRFMIGTIVTNSLNLLISFSFAVVVIILGGLVFLVNILRESSMPRLKKVGWWFGVIGAVVFCIVILIGIPLYPTPTETIVFEYTEPAEGRWTAHLTFENLQPDVHYYYVVDWTRDGYVTHYGDKESDEFNSTGSVYEITHQFHEVYDSGSPITVKLYFAHKLWLSNNRLLRAELTTVLL